MEILSNGIGNCVPVPNPFHELVGNGVVREGKCYVDEGKELRRMSIAVHHVENSRENRHFQVVPGEDLRGLEDHFVLSFHVLRQVLLDLVEVWFRSPRISIHDCQNNLFRVNLVLFEDRLEMLDTPGDIGRFSELLELSSVMFGPVDCPELVFEFLYKLIGFEL